jgi:hypothetical protein
VNAIQYILLKQKLPILEEYMNSSLSVYGLSNIKIIYHKTEESVEDINELKKIKKNDYEIFFSSKKHVSNNISSACGIELMILHFTYRMALNKYAVVPKSSLCIIDEELSGWNISQYDSIEKFVAFINKQYKHILIISHDDNLLKMPNYEIKLNRKNNELGFINNCDDKKVKKGGSKSVKRIKSGKKKSIRSPARKVTVI